MSDAQSISKSHQLAYIDVRVVSDAQGTSMVVPALSTGSALVEPLVDYFIHHSLVRSFSWMEKVREAVRLFLQYSLTNEPQPALGTASVPAFEHFQRFSHALVIGTVGRETGLDPTELCWRPSKLSKAGSVVRMLSDFFAWIDATSGNGSRFNPRYTGSLYDQMCAHAAFEAVRSRAFLGHTWGLNSASVELVSSPQSPRVASSSPPSFPDNLFETFLFEGFNVGGRYNYRNMLITLLLHGAGFRESEPFHLYVEDVVEDPEERGSALVRIFHPSEGRSPSSWIDRTGERLTGTRREYLAKVFAMEPRSSIRGSKHAGWKGGLHEDAKQLYKQAYWFSPSYGRLFWKIWLLYMVKISSLERHHPFAFVNTGANGGEMYAISKYEQAHASALHRIGLKPTKENGLTTHGHRHAYAQRLKRCEVPPLFIQRMLHHGSIESQQVYTKPSTDDIRAELVRAAAKLTEGTNARYAMEFK